MKKLILVSFILASFSLGLDLSQWQAQPWDGVTAQTEAKLAVQLHLKSLKAWLQSHELIEEKCSFLKCDELEAALESPAIPTLKEILNRFRKNRENLDDWPYIRVQQALRHFIRILEVKADGDYLTAFDRRKKKIEELGTKHALSQMEQEELGALLGWMNLTGQTYPSVEKLKQQYSYPNAQMKVSKKLLQLGYEGQDLSHVQTVSQPYEGGISTGTFTTRGRVGITLVPNNNYPMVGIEYTGQAYSPSVYWRRKKVELWSHVTTNLRAVEQIQFTLDGLKTHRPQSWATSDVRPYSVRSRFRFIEKIAWNQAWSKVGSAEANASQGAAQRAAQTLQQQIQEQLAKTSQEFGDKFKKNIIFQGAYPKALSGRTTENTLEVGITEQNSFELASSIAPPGTTTKELDLTIQFHESSVRNFLEVYLGGKREQDHNFYAAYKLVTGDEPFELRPHDRADRWYIMNEERAPMVPHFEGGKIKFVIRGSRACIKYFGQEKFDCLDGVFSATAIYIPIIRGKNLILARDGDVVIELKPREESLRIEEFQKFFHKKFSAFLSEEWNFDGLTLPKGSTWEKFTKLEPVEFTSHSHWLTIGYSIKD